MVHYHAENCQKTNVIQMVDQQVVGMTKHYTALMLEFVLFIMRREITRLRREEGKLRQPPHSLIACDFPFKTSTVKISKIKTENIFHRHHRVRLYHRRPLRRSLRSPEIPPRSKNKNKTPLKILSKMLGVSSTMRVSKTGRTHHQLETETTVPTTKDTASKHDFVPRIE